MPVLGADSWYEIWVSPQSVTTTQVGRLMLARDDDMLFGCLTFDEACQSLEAKAFWVYSKLFETLDREGYPALLRVWNYFPDLNEDQSGIERYRAFNVSRDEAFVAEGGAVVEGAVPAACALGTAEGELSVCYLAGGALGTVIENPRQTNAYCYPSEFGPRGPTVFRAMLVGDALLISGTASIVGSESMHPGDVAAQLEETLRNVGTVVDEARRRGFRADDRGGLCLNVYLLRHAADYPIVRARRIRRLATPAMSSTWWRM